MERLLRFVMSTASTVPSASETAVSKSKPEPKPKPCLLLLPHYVYTKEYYRRIVVGGVSQSGGRSRGNASSSSTLTKQANLPVKPFFLVPARRYNYAPPSWVQADGSTAVVRGRNTTAPFPSFWYCFCPETPPHYSRHRHQDDNRSSGNCNGNGKGGPNRGGIVTTGMCGCLCQALERKLGKSGKYNAAAELSFARSTGNYLFVFATHIGVGVFLCASCVLSVCLSLSYVHHSLALSHIKFICNAMLCHAMLCYAMRVDASGKVSR